MTVFATLYEDGSKSSSSSNSNKMMKSQSSKNKCGDKDHNSGDSSSQSDDDDDNNHDIRWSNGEMRRYTYRLIDKLSAKAAAQDKDLEEGNVRSADVWAKEAAEAVAEWQMDREKVAAARAVLLDSCME